MDQKLKDANRTTDIVVAELAYLGEDVTLDVNVLHLCYFLEALHYSVLLEGVEVDHDGLASELLQTFYVGIVADEDNRSVNLGPAFLVLLCIWFSEGFESFGRYRVRCFIFIIIVLSLIILLLFPSF